MEFGARGSRSFLAGEKEIRVLFTNRALAEIEGAVGKSILEIANGFSDGKTGIRDTAIMLRFGMEASRRDNRDGGRSITLEDAYKVLDEVGFATVISEIMPAIVEVLTPVEDDEDTDNPK